MTVSAQSGLVDHRPSPPAGGAAAWADPSAPALAEPASAAVARDQMAAYFSRCAETIGLPRSLAAIYATLFLADSPLPFEEIVARSGLSKASASTGLRDLERLHGVERVVVPADRRSFYRAQLSIRRVLSAFLTESLKPGLEDGARMLQSAAGHLGDPATALADPATQHLRVRLESLLAWHDRASGILPMLSLLGATRPDD